MTEEITFLEILHRMCVRQGWALLLTATVHPAGFATKGHVELRALTIAKPAIYVHVRANPAGTGPIVEAPSRGQRIKAGKQIATCALDGVGGDLDAAAELLVELLTHRKAEAA